MQSLISEFNALFSSQSFSIIFPFSNTVFILFGNFSLSFMISISSLKYALLYILSTSNSNSSSLSFKVVLIFVNIFCICAFILLNHH